MAAGLMLAASLAACQRESPPPAAGADRRVEILSWWTTGSESAALRVFQDAFLAAHPGVSLVDGAVQGGAGSKVQRVLAERLAAGRPPDVWQTFAGASIQAWVDAGRVDEIDAVFGDTGLADALPPPVLSAVSAGAHRYGLPTGAHRGNVLFFNTAVLDKAGIETPGPDYSIERLRNDLARVAASGVAPLCLGGRDPFTRVELFESVLLGTVGADGWDRIAGDRFDWDGPELRTAAQRFGELLDRADPQADEQSWDEATRRLVAGRCAFLAFNDSALGEMLRAANGQPLPIGQTVFPGTRPSFLAVVDTFVVARRSADHALATGLLRVMADPRANLAFNRIKGSVPLRRDIAVDELSPYQQQAARDLREGRLLLSLTHGELFGPRLQQGLYEAVQRFSSSRDPAVFGESLRRAVAGGTAIAP
ncbi:MAG: ABC transporter substrate-binding protein [Burkholderiaceae bacterium]